MKGVEMNITPLIKEYHELKNKIENTKALILSKHNIEIFKARIIEISKLIIRGIPEPKTCCSTYSIPFSLVKKHNNGEDPFQGYPCNIITWDIYNDWIVVTIEARFRGETDSVISFRIRTDDKAHANYIESLTAKAHLREEKNREMEIEQQTCNQQAELELYAELKAKYGDI